MTRSKIRERFRRLPGVKRLVNRRVLEVAPGLADSGPSRVGDTIADALERHEPAARRRVAAHVLQAYAAFDDDDRARFFGLLATRFGVDDDRLDAAVEAFRAAEGPSRPVAVRALRQALTPRSADLLRAVTGLPGGVKLLVDLRADLLAVGGGDAALALLDDDLAGHLASVFDVGVLELRRITWESASAALLERLMAYEAVHEIETWDDLKHRLDRDRRCYAFLHPAMPDEPLVFVAIALTRGIADDLHRLLDRDASHTDPAEADTAVFYSITNCQPGLARINLGNELIKRVMEELGRDLPRLRTYATLSPMPNFRQWAEVQLTDDALTRGEREAFGDEATDVAAVLADDHWPQERALVEQLRPGLLSMAARYVTTMHDGRALDPVGHFHLTNGAGVERLNWLANPATYEIERSFGVMVNYKYDADQLEENVERYRAGTIAASGQVHNLVR